MTAVTKSRTDQLKDAESVIERGMKSFWEMGEAYREVRDERLYKEAGHDRFADYCRERWGLHRTTVDGVISATEVRTQLAERDGDLRHLPENHEQARYLTTIPDADDRAEAWNSAVKKAEAEGKLPTGRHVKEAVKEHKAKRSPPPPKKTREERATERAMENVSQLRSRAEAFMASVENVLESKDALPEHEVQSAAYTIVSTLHNVALLMEEAGVIQHSVASGVLSGLDEEIEDQEVEVVA